MKDFNYFQPTDIRYGKGRVHEIGEIVAGLGKRCLVVTVPVFPAMAPIFETVLSELKSAGVAAAHFDGVQPNPTTDVVTQGSEMARAHEADVVLGVGGGSSMDTAKAIAVESTHDGTAWDYLFFRDTQPTEKTLPVAAVTTTSGTGSQVTQVAVVTNTREKNKSAIYHSRIYPRVAVVDPELMRTVPEHVTASTGFDVFAHAFESFINPGGSPYTDLLALEAIRLVIAHLPDAVREGENMDARSHMAWADTLAGLCIANAGVTLPHGIGMAVSGIYPHVMHGESLAVVYPAIMRYTHHTAPKKFARVGRIFDPSLNDVDDEAAARRTCDLVEGFLGKIGMNICFEDLKVPEEELKALAEASLVLPDYKNHPRVATLNEVFDLLKKSCRG